MSKYSDEQLKRMATDFIQAESAGDIRCHILLQTMTTIISGLTIKQCMDKIKALANK